jgi:serine/threonine-protein kinase
VIDPSDPSRPIKRVGRYAIFQQIAAGGMATVHLARLAGPVGFRRVVAVKALHPHLCQDPEFKAMLIEEARLAARIRHPNVVPTLDVVATDSELFIVMEYVEGESLSTLRKAARRLDGSIPPPVCAAIMAGVLQGLHAAHEAQSEKGEPLHIVHRDVSPQNILVGVDGVARVLDFGVAKALQARQETRAGQVKGKSSYMAPEQIRAGELTRRVDIFAAAVVLWELLTARRLFGGRTDEERVYKVLETDIPLPSSFCPDLSPAIDALVMKGLERKPGDRYETALDMAMAIERSMPMASQRVVGEWVTRVGAEALSGRMQTLRQMEKTRLTSLPPAPHPVGPDAFSAPHPAAPEAFGARPVAGASSAAPMDEQKDEESLPTGGTTEYALGRRAPPEAAWWRDRRAVVAALAITAFFVLLAALAGRARSAKSPAPAAIDSAQAAETVHAGTVDLADPAATALGEASEVAGSASAAPSAEVDARTPPVNSDSNNRKAPPRRAGQAQPAAKSTGARAFRPTEL